MLFWKRRGREPNTAPYYDAPQVEIRPLLDMIYSSKMDIPVFFDLNHEIAIKNREQLDKRSSVHVWRLESIIN